MILLNIFDKKLKETTSIESPLDPIELYDTLIHEPGYEYLRGFKQSFLMSGTRLEKSKT